MVGCMLGHIPFLGKLPFQKKLLFSSLLLSVLPVLLLGSAASYVASTSIQEEVNAKHEATLQQIGLQVDSLLKRLDYMSIQIAGDLAIEKSARLGISMDDRETLDATLDMVDTVRKHRTLSDIPFNAYIVYNKFDTVYSNKYGLLTKSDFPYFDALRQYAPKFTGSLFLPSNTYPNQTDLLIVRPIGSSSTVDGVLFLEAEPTRLYELLRSVQMAGDSQLLVVDRSDRIVLSRNPQEIGTTLPSPFARKLEQTSPPSPTDSVAYGEERYHVSVHRSGYNDWTYVIIAPQGGLTAKASLIKKVTWAMAGCLALIWGLIALFASKRLYNPIRTLLQKLPSRAKPSQDGLQQIDAFMQQVMDTNRRLDSELREQAPQLRENTLIKLLHGEWNDAEFAIKRQQYDLPLHGRSFGVCVFEVDAFMEFRTSYLGKDRSLMMYALTKLVTEMASATPFSSVTVSPSLGQVALIVGTDNPDTAFAQQIEELCGRVRIKAKELFRFTLTAGVSRVRPEFRGIHESYLEAIDLLSFRLLLGRDLTISQQAIESMDTVKQSARDLIKRQRTIVKRIAEGDMGTVYAEFEEMVREIPHHLTGFKPVTGIFTNLVGEIDHLLEQLGFELQPMFPYNVYARINEAESLDQLKDWFKQQFFPAFRSHFEKLTVPNQTKIVQQVAEYIVNGAEGELSLQEAASRFGLSQSQLSRMFKEEMHVNFIDYCIEVRMSRAKEWLVHSDMPIKQIADRLHYTTTQNFSRAFKQTTGMSPGQYRVSVRHQE
ncbi:helix-turn-helix domain-containing protein [Paenibacillus hemerocallicola]|uniref:Helix-turn-helix domain-containing protein n=2 Tax=Paenibacillus hemerocallicola TaxID=1172614 RepID=A0A5C4TCP5_9BACL|nr:helix-turn-helix domain-containing protein [Paenibacillus hemerocallicola]